MKLRLLISLALLPVAVFGITRHVSLDGTQAYSSIQAAIDDAVSGDLVLVHPGRYMENIDLSGKSNVTLASFEYTTADTSYISNTIIDGSNGDTSTILIYENAVNCTIRGFSITGGKGYDFWSGQVAYQVSGGGILILRNNSVTLTHLEIYGNHAAGGGGITVSAPNTVVLSGVNIYNNYATYLGGGMCIGSHPYHGGPGIVFNPTDRCSIYNNYAPWGMDIHWHYTHAVTMDVYLKKFTVPQWEKYYADYFDYRDLNSPYSTFDIQEAYLQPLDADLYVSPGGDDGNDGLSPASPLKTPSLAMQRIASNPQNPNTVHLMPGEHHNIIGGDYISIAIKDHCILKGASEEQTRIYGSNLLYSTGAVTMGISRYGMTLRDLSITTVNSSAIFSWDVFDSLIENVCIENSTVEHAMVFFGLGESTYTMRNLTMRNNCSTCSDFGLRIAGRIITLDNIVMTDNQTLGLPEENDQEGGAFDIDVTEKLTIRNSKFVNNTHYSVDGWANFRIMGWSMEGNEFGGIVDIDNCLFAYNHTYGGARDYRFTGMTVLNITNTTFANNVGTYGVLLSSGSETNRIVNTIFSNNSAPCDIWAFSNSTIENCLFTKNDNIYRTFDNQPLEWGVNNLVGTDPLFSGSDPALPCSYYLYADAVNGFSPAIDAGTMDSAILPAGYVIPEYDAFGFNRVYGSGIDIGCFESQGHTGNEDVINPPANALQLANYPNPFNPSTTISYSIPAGGNVNVSIYNVKGQLVNTLVSEYKSKGNYQIVWQGKDSNGRSVASGLYFARLVSGGKSISGKMLLMK